MDLYSSSNLIVYTWGGCQPSQHMRCGLPVVLWESPAPVVLRPALGRVGCPLQGQSLEELT